MSEIISNKFLKSVKSFSEGEHTSGDMFESAICSDKCLLDLWI